MDDSLHTVQSFISLGGDEEITSVWGEYQTLIYNQPNF
jgi:hypothetical protein